MEPICQIHDLTPHSTEPVMRGPKWVIMATENPELGLRHCKLYCILLCNSLLCVMRLLPLD